MLGRRIAARKPPPTCLPELRRALLDEWCNIPQDQIDNLILSMPRRSISLVILTSRFEATQGLFWDGPCNFEPRSDDEDGTPSPSFHAAPAGGHLATAYDLACNRPHTRRTFGGIGFRTWNLPAPKLRPYQ
ncbi:hypothetical protein AVEN_115011-1 [Araneus ventricosus]|uniref:Uncharacterized protein n=1 Tax=Araneus ventricosus TaxID=182803 RepID=A0A4Y1ZY33_ARAVE|nr:hypothetical protein AVEN_115011-1 [Araneus ventricosus]